MYGIGIDIAKYCYNVLIKEKQELNLSDFSDLTMGEAILFRKKTRMSSGKR